MSDEIDPEVIADLKLRAYSQFDSTRSRGEGVYDWKPPAAVTQWKCKTPPCKSFVDVDAETVERWEIFNKRLRANGDSKGDARPIASHDVMLCDSCRAEHAKIQPQRLRKRTDRMADVIRQLKAGESVIRFETNEGRHSANRTETFAKLIEWGHPDVTGLQQSLAEKDSPNKKPTKGYV